MIEPLCPVRGCALPLRRAARALRCERAHSFDLAASGYCNLLQPQDRRAREPGDAKAVVQARRRWLDAGRGEHLLRALEECLGELRPAAGAALLDLGCGEGYFLAGLARRFALEACGLDISRAALDAAARRHAGILWFAANADRRLPFADGSFGFVVSLAGRWNAAEAARVLAPDGAALVAVPGPDDLVELRAAVLGEGRHIERTARVRAEAGPGFRVVKQTVARARAALDAAAIADALAMSYRGARRSERERAAGLERLDCTLSADLLVLRRTGGRTKKA